MQFGGSSFYRSGAVSNYQYYGINRKAMKEASAWIKTLNNFYLYLVLCFSGKQQWVHPPEALVKGHVVYNVKVRLNPPNPFPLIRICLTQGKAQWSTKFLPWPWRDKDCGCLNISIYNDRRPAFLFLLSVLHNTQLWNIKERNNSQFIQKFTGQNFFVVKVPKKWHVNRPTIIVSHLNSCSIL